MGDTRTHVVLPEKLIRDIDELVGKRGRSAFLAEVAEREVRRRRLRALLEQPGPWWNPEDHPELRRGAAAWVRKLRQEGERIRNKRLRRS